jgi:type III restriction enzyme
MSYVFTASQNFHDTLESIVAGLNKSGFSRKDFRVTGEQSKDLEKPQILPQLSFNQGDSDIASEIDDTPIILNNTQTSGKQSIIEIIKSAKTEENEFEEKVAQAESDITWGYTDDLAKATNFSEVKDHYKDIFKNITLPQFYLKLPENSLFNSGDKDTLLSSEYLLDDEFELKKQNTEIDFDAISLEVYQVDIEESGKKDDYTPKYKKLSEIQSKAFLDYINSLPEEGQITQLTDLILNSMGRMEQFADSDMRTYIRRVIEDMDNAERTEIKSNPVTYAMKIKKHIEKLAEKRTEDVFSKWIDTDKVFLKYEYILPKHITPTFPKDSITKSLYVSEQDMNTFESEIITQIASLENVVFWHKIIERKGFFINGFINHYPDFLIYTKSGKIILLETKGDHLDGSDAVRKLKLGRIWANKAGINYRYFMVFKENPIKDAHFVEELMNVIKEL